MSERSVSDSFSVCPYNSSHVIRNRRFIYHLLKCEAKHKHILLKACPFNATHRLRPEDFCQHLINCPQRQTIENHRYFPKSNQSDSMEDEDKQPPGAVENEFFNPPARENSDAHSVVAARMHEPSAGKNQNPGIVDSRKKLGMGRGQNQSR